MTCIQWLVRLAWPHTPRRALVSSVVQPDDIARMHVQLMASARHAIDSRDASLLPMGMYVHHMTWRPSRFYYLWFHVALLCCWCCCGLFYDYVKHTEHWVSPRKEGSCVDGAVPRHSIELALDISLAPHAYKGPCLLGRPARRHSRMRVQGEC